MKTKSVKSTILGVSIGNRSTLAWVLDPYKASKPTDKTILEHFNTYRFADYKQNVIELLSRECGNGANHKRFITKIVVEVETSTTINLLIINYLGHY